MNVFAFFLGPWEIIILILVIVLLLFGNRVPKLARNIGRSFVEFKAGLKDKDGKESGESRDDIEDNTGKKIPPGKE